MVLEDVNFEDIYAPFDNLVADETVTRTRVTPDDTEPTLDVWCDGRPADVIESVSTIETSMLDAVPALEGPLTTEYAVDGDENRVSISMRNIWFSGEVSLTAEFSVPEQKQETVVSYDEIYHDAVVPRGFDVFSPAQEPEPSLVDWNTRSFNVLIKERYEKTELNPDETVSVDDGTVIVEVALDIWGLTSAEDTEQFLKDTVAEPLDTTPSAVNATVNECGLFGRSEGQLGEKTARLGVSGVGGILFTEDNSADGT